MKVNILMRYFTPNRSIKIKRLLIPSVGKNVEHRELSHIARWSILTHLLWRIFGKVEHVHIFDLGIPLLVSYPMEILRYKHREICLRTFTAALFRIANKLEIIQVSVNRQVDRCIGIFIQWNTLQQ